MRDDGKLLQPVRPATPPPELRGRVLAAARATAQKGPAREPAGLGFARLDLAWVGALLLLLACHAALSIPNDQVAPQGPEGQRNAVGTPGEEQVRRLAAQLDLPPEWIDLTTRRAPENVRDAWRELRADPLFRNL